ncbi:MAG: HigA family addiction module antidote protein [Maritimibacter sp.]|nr:HigA family addiction module antidote protein [Maritimibacter sp.]
MSETKFEAAAPQTDEPVAVSPATVAEWLDAGEVVLVDVRETKEYDLEHIAGALLMPLSSLEADLFPAVTDKPLVLHCAIGKRSAAAARMLLKAGHQKVLHMEGGLTAWKAAGLPIEEAIEEVAAAEKVAPLFLCPTPGAVLREEYLGAAKLDAAGLSAAIGVSVSCIDRLLAGERPVDAELSLRLARYFSTAADFWLQLQVEHDIERARHFIGETIRSSVRPRAA